MMPDLVVHARTHACDHDRARDGEANGHQDRCRGDRARKRASNERIAYRPDGETCSRFGQTAAWFSIAVTHPCLRASR